MKPFSRFLFLFAACLSALAVTPAWADPPGRVGRISLIGGAVFLFNDHYDAQQAAQLNWPVTTGDTLTTAAGARAEVRIGSTAIRMDGDSQLEFGALDDQQLRLRLLRGTVAVRVRDIGQARQFTLTTTQGSVALNDAGTYRFEAGRRPGSTAVAVFQGAAAFAGTGLSLGIAAGQQAEIFGESNLGYAITAAVQGDFDAWGLARDRRDDESRSVRFVSREMTGYEDLDAYGDWREVAEYGSVWYPRRIAVGWAPYRSGHWAWVRPWGWTWVDEAPWGFAPFHYGRWVFVGGIWGWMPGPRVARPVYAPALVAWVGRPGWQVSFSVGIGPAVGWFPLGPREVFVPAYTSSTGYMHRINAHHVRNIAHIADAQREPQRAHHVHRSHRDAVTVVPSTVVSSGAAVSRYAHRFAQGQSIDALPAAAAAPALAPPPRRGRATAAAPDPSTMPQERAASPRDIVPSAPMAPMMPATPESRPSAPPQRQAERTPAAPRESRAPIAPTASLPVAVPSAVSTASPPVAHEDARREAARPREVERSALPVRRMEGVAPAQAPSAASSAVTRAAPEDARLGAARSREVERPAPPVRRMDTVAPVQASPPRIEREMQRPAAEARHQVPTPTMDAAPQHSRGTMRDAGPSPRTVAPQGDERKGNGRRERGDDGRDRGRDGREGGRGARP